MARELVAVAHTRRPATRSPCSPEKPEIARACAAAAAVVAAAVAVVVVARIFNVSDLIVAMGS